MFQVADEQHWLVDLTMMAVSSAKGANFMWCDRVGMSRYRLWKMQYITQWKIPQRRIRNAVWSWCLTELETPNCILDILVVG